MQHFLLSAASRSLSLKKVYKMGEAVAYDTFRKIRWPETNGEAVCPKCGCYESYNITTRRKFKCKGCHHQFSVTSGTMFHSRKLDFVDLLAGICLFVTGSKGMSAVQFSRTMDVQYKTAWVWCHKMRECLADETDTAKLSGEVEIDGCYVGGHVRKANYKTDRKDRRLNANLTNHNVSTTVKPIAIMAHIQIGLKATLRDFVKWYVVSITGYRLSIFINMQNTRLG